MNNQNRSASYFNSSWLMSRWALFLIYFCSITFRLTFETSPDFIKLNAIKTLNALQAYASLQNPEILKDDIFSGSDLLLTSLPLDLIYQFARMIGLQPIVAMQVHIILEILIQNIVLYSASMLLIRPLRKYVVATLTFFNFFQIVLPINLANWGFLYGWNYGFAYSFAILTIVAGVKKKWSLVFLLNSILLSIHFTVGIITGLISLSLFFSPFTKVKIKAKDYVLAILGIPFLAFAINGVASYSSNIPREYNSEFIEQLKLFQVHLFVDLLDLAYLKDAAPVIIHWAALFSTCMMIVRKLKEEIQVLNSLENVLHLIFVISILACLYSQVDTPNSTLILMAFHRLSILIPYVFLILIPLLLSGELRKHNLAMTSSVAILIIHVIGYRRITAVISLVICILFLLTYLRGDLNFRSEPSYVRKFTLLVEFILITFAILIMFYLYTPKHLLPFIIFICISVFFIYREISEGLNRHLNNRIKILLVSAAIMSSIFGVAHLSKSRIEIINRNFSEINAYYQMETWAQKNTPTDAIFFLPLDNDYFGWESFSQRASIGKPLDWLHYSILYSRDQIQFENGVSNALLFDVNIKEILTYKNSDLNLGEVILKNIASNYDKFSDEKVIAIARKLETSYLITKDRALNERNLKLVYKINHYRIYKI
jgi:hypothetical protein